MIEKTAKKVGEAYAFAHVLQETFIQNKEIMAELFGKYAKNILEVTETQKQDLQKISEDAGMDGVVLPKAEKTGIKITKMGEMYVGDDWDDIAEVLEWMSFFVGGAIVHWQLISGSSEKMENEEFGSIAGIGTEYYVSLMEQLRDYAIVVGKARAEIQNQ